MNKVIFAFAAMLLALPLSVSWGQAGGMPMERMQEKAQTMQQQMEEIRKTEDPDKRDQLIDQHMKTMQETMDMMGGGAMGGMAGGKAAAGEDLTTRMNHMEQRMDMMQMMMNQLVQSQGAIEETRKLHDHRKVHK